MANNTKKKIVILGAGFGGIKAAFSLCKNLDKLLLNDKYELILVDKNSYHTYTPTLYEASTTSKTLANQIDLKSIITFDLKKIFKNKNISLLQETVNNVDLIEGDIHFDSGKKLKFDYLVLALGSETNFFGIPGLEENSLTLKTFTDAIKIRDAVWSKYEEMVNAGKKELEIVIGGGGSTGIELAGEIKSWLCQLEEEFKKCPASVKIIEGMPNVLPGFDEKVVHKVTKRLRKIGVELLLNELIEKVDPGKTVLKSGRIVKFDLLIWSGGVKAISLMGALPLKREAKGRVRVLEEMECLPQSEDLKLYGKIYGLGDAICFYNPETNKPIPLVAEAAIDSAKIIAHNIIEDIKITESLNEKADYKKFTPKRYTYVISVGGKYAVAKIGPLIISGFAGWVLKGLVELYYLLFNVLPPFQAIKVWLKGLRIFVQNDRLG
ncbi:MAG: NAD(P)/FAD-dependent oxidoreductase [Candidatus Harrisonbacteria bacterium]|nr:NAD(P)/FAD-dependent oxidoreductase [Candidatus Harrisonbacteria bacterium]